MLLGMNIFAHIHVGLHCTSYWSCSHWVRSRSDSKAEIC